MNKKEQAEVERLKTELAFRRTYPIEPDIPIPAYGGGLSKGFMYVGERSDWPRVEVACSSSVSHAVGRDDKTTTQQPIKLFSTKVKALRAMRYKLEQYFADRLRRIDVMIEDAQNEDV